MKKILAILLTGVIFMSMFAVSAYAIPLSSGTEALNAEFLDDDIPNKCDVVFYSPVKSANDTTKYPIFFWVHGMNSGLDKRSQLDNYEFSNWASDEYQARFGEAGGCFLVAPRASFDTNDWNPSKTETFEYVIEYYLQMFKNNIDTSRIYIGGYSTGGAFIWDMLVAYPQLFAAAVIAAPVTTVTDVLDDSTLSKICDIPMWIMSSDYDFHKIAKTDSIRPVFNKLVALSSNKANLRLTTFSDAVFADETRADGSDAKHYIWECITYDMHMSDGVTPYKYATTVDGLGNTINFDDSNTGVISWLMQQQKTEDRDTSNKGESVWDRFINFFKNFFNKIKNFFTGIFN